MHIKHNNCSLQMQTYYRYKKHQTTSITLIHIFDANCYRALPCKTQVFFFLLHSLLQIGISWSNTRFQFERNELWWEWIQHFLYVSLKEYFYSIPMFFWLFNRKEWKKRQQEKSTTRNTLWEIHFKKKEIA